jgi:hypothetical protein
MTIIAVICPGPPERTPSTYYRFGQYKDLWREQGAELIFVPKQELARQAFCLLEKADIIVNQKCLLSSKLFRRIQSLGKPLFFDLDDLIWHRAGKDYSCLTKWKVNRRIALWAKGVDQVICANTYLQNALLRKTGVTPVVVPMSLNLDVWRPRYDQAEQIEGRSQNGRFDIGAVRVGWTGSPEYHWLLRKLEPALIQAQKHNQSLKFSIHSGVDPQLDLDYEFLAWQKGNEADYVKSIDIGLLPMDSESLFSLGKSPIKGLQYLACGVVPVGNFCGAALDFFNSGNSVNVSGNLINWTNAIMAISQNLQIRTALQAQGVADVRLFYSHLKTIQALRLHLFADRR